MKNYFLSKHLGIPTREEFHRQYAGPVTILDFSTQQPPVTKPHITPSEQDARNRKHQSAFKGGKPDGPR